MTEATQYARMAVISRKNLNNVNLKLQILCRLVSTNSVSGTVVSGTCQLLAIMKLNV